MKDIRGEVVSEDEVASDLGFADVHELRRWSTNVGFQVVELKHELYAARGEASGFRWHGMRQVAILERLDAVLVELRTGVVPDRQLLDKLLLAVRVVRGQAVDWDHVLDDWLTPLVLPTGDTDYVI